MFPKVWYMHDWHIVAIQSIGLANILLMAYNPSMARIGPDHKRPMRVVDSNLKSTVLDICGVAMSNRQSPTSLLTACLAITVCADRFTEDSEQKALMDIVITTSSDNNYWPSTAMEDWLRDVWAWER